MATQDEDFDDLEAPDVDLDATDEVDEDWEALMAVDDYDRLPEDDYFDRDEFVRDAPYTLSGRDWD